MPAPPMTLPPGRPMTGIVLVSLAVLVFAISDVVMKHLAADYSVPVIVAVRYLVNLVLLTVILAPRHRAALWRTRRTSLVAVRALSLAMGSLTMGLALQLMPVGETVAIVYLAPFLVMLLAVPLLGEKVSLIGWFGAITGFLGVVLIVRPGAGLDPWGVFFAATNAGFATGYHLLTRSLARTETMVAMLFHTALIGSVLFCLAALPNLQGFAPGIVDLGLMLLLGALASLGHFLFTAAYREAPASLLAPVNYLHLAWAGGLGWLVFDHVPDWLSTTGMVLVCFGGVAAALQAQLQRKWFAA